MTRTIIAIGLLVLLTAAAAAAAIEEKPSTDVRKLAYNPTYDLWFFIPNGRPKNLSEKVKNAYGEHRRGGVCNIPEDDWFFCASLEKIE